MRRVFAALGAAALAATALVAITPAGPVSAAVVTQSYQCTNEAFGAYELLAPTDLAIDIDLPASTEVGSATDVAEVTVAGAPGGTAPVSPAVPLDDVTLSLQVELELVAVTTPGVPAASTPVTATTTGAGASESITTVAPVTPWSISAAVPVPLGVPGINAGDTVWARPATLTYAWTANGGTVGSTTCVSVDASASLPQSSVELPVYGAFPSAPAPFAGSTTALSPVVPPSDECSIDAGGGPEPQCSINQQLEFDAEPGLLTLSQAGNLVQFTPVVLNGSPQVTTAQIQPVTISDARGNDAAWTLTASLTDFVNTTTTLGPNTTIPATAMSWDPTCTVVDALPGSVEDGGAGAFVAVNGSTNGIDTTASRVLCDHAAGLGGGTWLAEAELSLTVPPSVRTGLYTATMFLTVA
jgi:hypothetical protein